MSLLEINNNINREKENELSNTTIAKEQKSFLETSLGKIANGALDIGLKALLPDAIEDEIIDIKDVFLQEGFSSGVKTAVDKAIELGKNITGIFTGEFKNVSQAKDAIKKGGFISKISNLIDDILKKAKQKEILSPNITNLISTGKNLILDTAKKNIESGFETQLKSLEKISDYIENWTNYYNKQDLDNMQKQYDKIQKELKKVLPIENIINQVREIENLHNLIKNKGGDFNVSKYELDLAKQLA